MGKPIDLIQGPQDLLAPKTISLEPKHGWAIAERMQQISKEVPQVQQGSLYPALHRLEPTSLDQSQMGRNEQGKKSKILLVNRRGTRAVGKRSGELEPTIRRHQSCC
jgi:DNA-binding PadR family transcriptional regulator